MELHLDFKIIAGKNPAKELAELNKKFCYCCEIIEGNNGETLFDGFDIQPWAVEEFEAIARKYAEMKNPGFNDGISYIRKGESPEDPIVEYNNDKTEGHICVVLEPVDFELKQRINT